MQRSQYRKLNVALTIYKIGSRAALCVIVQFTTCGTGCANLNTLPQIGTSGQNPEQGMI